MIFLGYYDICNFSFDEKYIYQKPHNENMLIFQFMIWKKISKSMIFHMFNHGNLM